MLRIGHDVSDARATRLVLAGRVVGAWAEVLERECAEASASGRSIVIDLSEVVYISRSGVEALSRLGHAGVGIIGCSPSIAAMLEQAAPPASSR